jgi:hypothetical protein
VRRRGEFAVCGNHAEFVFHLRESPEKQGADLLREICAGEIQAAFGGEAIEFAARAVDGIAGATLSESADERVGDEFFVLGGVEAAEGEAADVGEAAAASCAREVVAACIIFAAAFS